MSTKEKLIIFAVLVFVILFFLFGVYVLVADIRGLYGGRGYPSFLWHWPRGAGGVGPGQPLSASDVNLIRDWMTFGYIDRVFNLPNDYLKTKLDIKSTKYPGLTIRSAAAGEKESASVYLEKVKEAVKQYLTANAPQ